MAKYRPKPKVHYTPKPKKIPKDVKKLWGKGAPLKPVGRFKNVQALILNKDKKKLTIYGKHGEDEMIPIYELRNIENMATIGMKVDIGAEAAHPSIQLEKTATTEVYKDPKLKTAIIKRKHL